MNICSTHLTLKKCLTYVTLTEFWKLNVTCNISAETAELRIWMTLKGMRQTIICGEQDFEMWRRKDWPYATFWTGVFERKESKSCAVLRKHRRKVKGEQMITLQMAQQLKTKNINVVPGQLFCCQCKAKFLLETDSLYW